MAAGVTMRQMLEAGVHFGHQTRRWNPNMRQFIFAERNGIHILDLAQTVQRLDVALQRVRETVSSGDQVLFVGTKKQARAIVRAEAERCGMPYVNTRWLGGTLTNFQTLSKRIQYFKELEERFATGDLARAAAAQAAAEAEGADPVAAAQAAEAAAQAAGSGLTKREQLELQKQYSRLRRSFGGLRQMERLPGLVFIVDPAMEDIAVHEANRANIPVIAMCDTNANPDVIDYPVPSNDDAIRAIQLMTGRVADAVLEGIAVGEVEQQFQQEAAPAPAPAEAEDEAGGDAPAAPAAPAAEEPAAPLTPEQEAVAAAEAAEAAAATSGDAAAEGSAESAPDAEAAAADTPAPEPPAAETSTEAEQQSS